MRMPYIPPLADLSRWAAQDIERKETDMVRKTRRAPVRKSLPTGVLDAVDQVTPALAQKLRASMAKPPFYVNEVLDMVIPDREHRRLLREAACLATAQVPRNPVFGYQ